MPNRSLRLVTVLALALTASSARALEWSDNVFGLRFGDAFREPANPNNISKLILSFTHVDGYKYGGNFLNVDMLYSMSGEGDNVRGLNEVKSAGAAEVYVVYRHTLSLNKVSGTKTFEMGGVLRDVGIVLGTDLNTKNHAFTSRKILPVAGVNGSLNVPGFLNVGVLAAKEWAVNSIVGKEVSFDVYPVFYANWKIPLYGPVTFEGYGNVNLPKGKDGFGNDTATEILLHPRLLVDVATLWGSKGLQLGGAFELWKNKFGNDNDRDATGGAFAKTFMVEAFFHL